MNDEEQKTFLIDMMRVMIRELLIYRAFCEKAKSDIGPRRSQVIDEFLNLIRNDAEVARQLGPDFAAFVREILQGSERDAGVALNAFLSEWTPRSDQN